MNCNWRDQNNVRRLGKGNGWLRNQGTRGDHQNYSNIRRSIEDLRTPAVTQAPETSHENEKVRWNKMQFFSWRQLCPYYYIDAPVGRWLSVLRKSLPTIAQEYCQLYWPNPESKTTQTTSCTATWIPSPKPSQSDEQDMRDTSGEVRTNSLATFYSVPLYKDEQDSDDQLELINSSSVRTLGVA